MVDINLPIKLYAEFMNIIVYINNELPTTVVYESIITSIQDYHRSDPLYVDPISIFDSKTYIINESDSQPRLTSKDWMGYLVGYGTRSNYRIYDSAFNTIYDQKKFQLNEQIVGPRESIITYDNIFQNRNTRNIIQMFLLLSSKTKQLKMFTAIDKNLTLYSVSSSSMNVTLFQKPNISSAILYLPIIFHGYSKCWNFTFYTYLKHSCSWNSSSCTRSQSKSGSQNDQRHR